MKFENGTLTLDAGESVQIVASKPEPPVVIPPDPVLRVIDQPKNVFAYRYTDTTKDFVAENILLTNGGFLLAESGGRNIRLKNVGSKGEVAGGGVYFLITANKRVNYIEWDNTAHPDWWINGSSSNIKGHRPGEAALRLMGKAGKSVIVGVNFRCGKWIDDNGTQTWWKQGVQVRDIEEAEFHACKFVGPVELGRQKDASGEGQRVGKVIFWGCSFTQLPTFSVRSSVGTVQYKGCSYIDESGKVTGAIPDGTV